MKTNLFKIIVLVIFGVSLAGCAGGDVKISETGFLPKPIIEPLPLKIGVFYNDKFQHFSITKELTPYPTYNIQFGKANIMLFDFILSNAFKEVTVVHDLRKETRRIQNLDAILEIGVHDYDCSNGLAPGFHVMITYIVEFHSKDNSPPNSWFINGNGYVRVRDFTTVSTWIKDATQVAMRDAAAQFLTDLCNQDEVKKLAPHHCN